MPLKRYLDTHEVAHKTGLSPVTIRRFARQGLLRSVQFAERGRLLFCEDEVVRTLKRIERLRARAAADKRLGRAVGIEDAPAE